MPAHSVPPEINRRRWEYGVFFSVVFVIIPLLTIGTIATYALFVWIFQMVLFGPPGPVGPALTSRVLPLFLFRPPRNET
jgi:nitrate reductase NapE component